MSRRIPLVSLLALTLLAGCKNVTGSSGSCSGAVAYTPGSTVTGTLGDNNCGGPDGGSGHLYSLTLTQQTNVKLTVASTAFTPLIAVYTAANKAVAQDMTSGFINMFLPAGSYKIFVARTAGNDGAYTLTSPTAALGGCSTTNGSLTITDMGFTLKGANIIGSVKAGDCGAVNAKMHWYRIRASSSDTLNTTVTADKNAGVYLVSATGDVVASKEITAGGTWTNKYITAADGFLTLRVESRAVGTVTNLPLGYTIKIQ